jgi:hypothetical protein
MWLSPGEPWHRSNFRSGRPEGCRHHACLSLPGGFQLSLPAPAVSDFAGYDGLTVDALIRAVSAVEEIGAVTAVE